MTLGRKIAAEICSLLIVAGCPFLSTNAAGPSPDTESLHTRLEPIRAEIEREIKAGEISPSGPIEGVIQQLKFIEEMRERSGMPDEAVLSQLRSLSGLAGSVSLKLRAVCDETVVHFSESLHQREKTRHDAVDALLGEAANTIRTASDSAALTPTLAKLRTALTQLAGADARSMERLQRACELVQTWQHDLSEYERGEFSRYDSVQSITRLSLEAFGPAIPASFYEDRKKTLAASFRKQAEDAIASAVRALSQAKTEADTLGIIDSLARLEKYKSSAGLGDDFVKRWNGMNSLCRDVAELLRNETPGKFKFAVASFQRLQANARANPGLIAEADLKAREDALFAEAARSCEEMLNRTVKELPDVKVPDEISEMDNSFSDYKEALRSRSHTYADLLSRLERVRRVADQWRLIIIAQNQHDQMQSGRLFDELATINAGPNPVIAPNVIAEKRKAMEVNSPLPKDAGASQSAADQWLAGLSARIKAIAKASDAIALHDEVQKHVQALSASSRNSSLRDLNELQNSLRSLAQFLDAGSHENFNFAILRTLETGGANPWRNDLTEVRLRNARDWISKQVQDPEMMRVPLEVSALESAVEDRAKEAAKRGDWLKVYKLLLMGQRGGRFGQDRISEELAGISEYLAAQKFEKAEQWAEAVRSYENVLRRIGDQLPIAEATERLRVLRKEHPEISAAASSTPR